MSAHAAPLKPSVPRICRAEELSGRFRVYEQIARRAYEIFHARSQGGELDDWLKAEAEFLRPVSLEVKDAQAKIVIIADVAGFEADELDVGLARHRVVIAGMKKPSATSKAGGSLSMASPSDELLRAIDLPAAVLPDKAMLRMQGGRLQIELPKDMEQDVIVFPC